MFLLTLQMCAVNDNGGGCVLCRGNPIMDLCTAVLAGQNLILEAPRFLPDSIQSLLKMLLVPLQTYNNRRVIKTSDEAAWLCSEPRVGVFKQQRRRLSAN